MEKDMTKGSPFKHILTFMLPLLIGNIFQQLYSMADTIIVGRTLGAEALAGVSITGSLNFIFLGIAIGVTGGFSVLISQFFGAKNEEGLKRSVAASFVLSAMICVIVTLLSVFLARPILQLMRTDPLIMDYALDYIVTVFWGLAASFLYNMVSGMVRALGDSRTPLYFLIFASLVNIGLDFLFILVFKMGTMGAGLATVISQLLAGAACLIFMLARFPVLRTKRQHYRLKLNFCWRHLAVGIPMALQFVVTGIGIMVQAAALNTLGVTVVAAYGAASKVDQLANIGLFSLGTVIATYVGQNYGAGDVERIKQGTNRALLIALVLSVFGLAVILIFGRQLIGLFLEEKSAEIEALGARYLTIQSSFYFGLGVLLLYRNALQGMGRSAITIAAGAIELVMRIVAALVFVRLWGFTGICFSNASAWLAGAALCAVVYFVTVKKLKTKFAALPPPPEVRAVER